MCAAEASSALQALETRIASALQPFELIVTAYLFGSQATGRARPDSDLDVALVFRAGLSPEQRAELMLDVIAALGWRTIKESHRLRKVSSQ